MRLASRIGRVTAWIAIFAVLLAALAPGVARALSSPQTGAAPWSEICSAAGPRIAFDTAPQTGSDRHDGMAFEHCPFCLNHAGHFALPAVPGGVPPVIAAGTESFSYFLTTPFSRYIRATAQPRAPPALS